MEDRIELLEIITDQEWNEYCERIKDYFNNKYGNGVYNRMRFYEFLIKNS